MADQAAGRRAELLAKCSNAALGSRLMLRNCNQLNLEWHMPLAASPRFDMDGRTTPELIERSLSLQRGETLRSVVRIGGDTLVNLSVNASIEASEAQSGGLSHRRGLISRAGRRGPRRGLDAECSAQLSARPSAFTGFGGGPVSGVSGGASFASGGGSIVSSSSKRWQEVTIQNAAGSAGAGRSQDIQKYHYGSLEDMAQRTRVQCRKGRMSKRLAKTSSSPPQPNTAASRASINGTTDAAMDHPRVRRAGDGGDYGGGGDSGGGGGGDVYEEDECRLPPSERHQRGKEKLEDILKRTAEPISGPAEAAAAAAAVLTTAESSVMLLGGDSPLPVLEVLQDQTLGSGQDCDGEEDEKEEAGVKFPQLSGCGGSSSSLLESAASFGSSTGSGSQSECVPLRHSNQQMVSYAPLPPAPDTHRVMRPDIALRGATDAQHRLLLSKEAAAGVSVGVGGFGIVGENVLCKGKKYIGGKRAPVSPVPNPSSAGPAVASPVLQSHPLLPPSKVTGQWTQFGGGSAGARASSAAAMRALSPPRSPPAATARPAAAGADEKQAQSSPGPAAPRYTAMQLPRALLGADQEFQSRGPSKAVR